MQDDAAAVIGSLADSPSGLPWGIAVYEPHWHQGVVGILAGRLKDRLHRPVFAFAPGESDELKGSGRSVQGFHLRDALDAIATRHPGLIERFGGHAMAAGLTMPAGSLPAFSAAFDALAREWLSEDQLQAVLWTDGPLASADMDLALARTLRSAGPWGQKFPEPVFDGVFDVLQERVVGERHLKLRLRQNDGLPVDAIWFNAELDAWAIRPPGPVHFAYRLDVNEYRGIESLQLVIEAAGLPVLDYTS